MKVACFGLSANPPHLGHFIAAKKILKNKLADQVWFIVCWRHSFNKRLAKSEHRFNMAKLMEGPGIFISDLEFKRKGISYTIDTVRILKKLEPHYKFYWIIGSDIAKDKSYLKWKDWGKLCKEIKFLVIQREGYEVAQGTLPSCFIVTSIKTPNISSSEIRERVRKGLSINGLVIPEVEKYILKNKLYLY